MKRRAHRSRPAASLVLALASLALAGCSLLEPARGGDLQAELDRHRRQWRAQGVESYTLQLTRICFCSAVEPVRVTVERGMVVERRFVESGEALGGNEARWWPAVEGLFDVVQDAIDRGAATIEVRYDPRWGHPASISIDYSRSVADEELGYTAAHLRPR